MHTKFRPIMAATILAALLLLMIMHPESAAGRTLLQRGQRGTGRDGAGCQDDSDCDVQYTCNQNNNAAFCVNTPAMNQASAPILPAPAPQQGLGAGATCTLGGQDCAPLNCIDSGTGAGRMCQ